MLPCATAPKFTFASTLITDMGFPTAARLPVFAYEDIDGVRFLVTRIGRSPLPADTRRCAFLEVA